MSQLLLQLVLFPTLPTSIWECRIQLAWPTPLSRQDRSWGLGLQMSEVHACACLRELKVSPRLSIASATVTGTRRP